MNDELEIQRLGWAGLQLACKDTTIVIDLFENRHVFAPYIEEVTGPLPEPSTSVDAALVTHLHADHADPVAIGKSLKGGGKVFRPGPAVGDDFDRASTAIAEAGLAGLECDPNVVEPWERFEVGTFTITAVPAVDGFGDPQTSWVVEAAGRRIFHGGDTLFHGYWWPIASRFNSFDAVFLPINGPVCNFPHRQPPSPYPVAMDPEQAVVAAGMLGARRAVPIHYDGIDQPGLYDSASDSTGRFEAAAAAGGVDAAVLAVGEPLVWS